MRKLGLVFTVAFFTLLPSNTAQAQDTFEVFGGYSYLRPNITAEEEFLCLAVVCPLEPLPSPTFVTSRQNLNGWEVAGGVHILPMLRVVADVSGHYGSTLPSGTSSTHQYTYLFGPEVSWPARVSPFAHVLVGGSHQTESSGVPPANPGGYNFVPTSDRTGFASAIGGGIDLQVISHLWIRPIQVDYLLARLGGSTQNQPRVSAGIALHF
jgi:hypothetical protein